MQQIKIADLHTQRVGMLIGRITAIDVFTVKSKHSEPKNSVVNLYKLMLQDETGSIGYDDWCKKPGVTRVYKVGYILKFDYAKLKPGKQIANTNDFYPATVTAEKGTVIQQFDENMKTPVTRYGTVPAPVVQPVPSVSLPPVASSPVAPAVPVAQSTPATEWMNVKAQYPNFYGFMDNLFNKLYDMLTDQQQTFVDSEYSLLMNAIWGKE